MVSPSRLGLSGSLGAGLEPGAGPAAGREFSGAVPVIGSAQARRGPRAGSATAWGLKHTHTPTDDKKNISKKNSP